MIIFKRYNLKLYLLRQDQRGVSLVELVMVIAAIAFLALLINNLPSALSSINRSRHTSIAREIVSKEIDYWRKQTYVNLSNDSGDFSDSKLSTLPSASGNYLIEDCPLTVCTDQEEAKQVTVKVSWNESGDNKSVQMVTIVGNGGLGQ